MFVLLLVFHIYILFGGITTHDYFCACARVRLNGGMVIWYQCGGWCFGFFIFLALFEFLLTNLFTIVIIFINWCCLIFDLIINFSVQYRNKVNALPSKTVSLDINNGYANKNELSAEDLLGQLDLDDYGSTPPRTRYVNVSLIFYSISLICLLMVFVVVSSIRHYSLCLSFDDVFWWNDLAIFLCHFFRIKIKNRDWDRKQKL